MRFDYLLSTKSDCFKTFVKFQNLVENLKGRTIKTVVSDNGGEFVNSKFKNLFDVKGIPHLQTAPYTPQQNPVAERGNRTLLERVPVMMHNNKVPSEWWGEASAMAAFILNRTPMSTINFVAPLSKWDSSVSLHLAGLHPFGCTAIMSSPKARWKSKIDPTGILCMLVGIQEGHHNYRLFDPITGSIYISHNCVFKNKEAFWPSHSSPTPVLVQEPLLLPSLPLFNVSLHENRNYPEGTVANSQATPFRTTTSPITSKEEASLTSPPLFEQPESTSSLENSHPLPKGWTYDVVPIEAPHNVDYNISDKTILSGGCSRKPPNHFAGAVVNKAPGSFREAMSSSKSNAWLLAVQN
ncbi:hypothetical protein O181_018064 [Austropuccinia psidii MF-1]|uniref:Integrase catalytic domain-containing protein n=1 Tax=Austropuccinia psidii MF-1 TaxID=1389203 RepID=A0A9Q3C4K4_9BASI|nr:hypothetical protein [Austropuccinia psidii MF-1]